MRHKIGDGMRKRDTDSMIWHIDSTSMPDERNELETAYLDSIIRLGARKTGKRYNTVLDVPCGMGRLHGGLRRCGYDVYGLDINRGFIAEAKKAHPECADRYLLGDMRSFDIGMRFDVVVSWFTSFGYFKADDDKRALGAISSHMNRGALVILDLVNEQWYKANMTDGYLGISKNGDFVEIEDTKAPGMVGGRPQTIHSSRLYKRRGRDLAFVRDFKVPIRQYTVSGITKMLDAAGIRLAYAFERMNYKRPTPASSRNFVIAGIKR